MTTSNAIFIDNALFISVRYGKPRSDKSWLALEAGHSWRFSGRCERPRDLPFHSVRQRRLDGGPDAAQLDAGALGTVGMSTSENTHWVHSHRSSLDLSIKRIVKAFFAASQGRVSRSEGGATRTPKIIINKRQVSHFLTRFSP